ncbi:alpha-mannosidase, partial [Cutibacterium acnes subsp. acnes]|nr:alpha-mannosidase [Cutibacterium acnes subsp. acnes]
TEGVHAEENEEDFIVDNGLLRMTVDAHGLITHLVDTASGRDAIPAGQRGNLLQIHPDFPNMWDAWDIDPFYANTVTDLDDGQATMSRKDGSVTISVTRTFGHSSATQSLTVNP